MTTYSQQPDSSAQAARQPLPGWEQLDLSAYVKLAILGGLLGWFFHIEIAKTVGRWMSDASWSHGFLIPLFSLYFLHQNRHKILTSTPRPSWFCGLGSLFAVLLLYWFNTVQLKFAYGEALLLIAAVGATTLFVGGWAILRLTWLPIAYLFFAVPLPGQLYTRITLPMQGLAAQVSAVVLNAIPELEATLRGVVIDVLYRGVPLEPSLQVAEACSGMRLLMAFVALGVAMAYLHDRPLWQRLVLLISTVPIAVLCNVIRVLITALIYIFWDPQYAQGVYHDLLGMLMLPLAFLFYGGIAWLMSNLFVEEKDVEQTEDIIIVRRQHKQSSDIESKKYEVITTPPIVEDRNETKQSNNDSEVEKSKGIHTYICKLFISFFSFEGRWNRQKYFLVVLLISLIFIPIFIILPNLATYLIFSGLRIFPAIKRLHDIGMPGGLLILSFFPPSDIILGLFLLFKKGMSGANRYGNDPLQDDVDENFDYSRYKNQFRFSPKKILYPAFLVCVMILLTAATTKSLVIRTLGWHLTKHPLPLKQSLHEMDEGVLSPYIVRNKIRIDNPDILATLGTEDYLQWIIEDPDADPAGPLRYCSVFVTYYTGDPDMVPHVPDECYVGGGNRRKAGYIDTASLLRSDGQNPQTLRYQNILFTGTGDGVLAPTVEFYVAYLFHVNGQYSGSRSDTRIILSQNFLSKFSYFSKVEWQFYGFDTFGRIYPGREQVVQASEKLLQVLLPALEDGHWPDWEAANREEVDNSNSQEHGIIMNEK